MNKVLLQAELLGEAILESEEYVSMRLAEQAVLDNDEAQKLIQEYSVLKDVFQAELAKKPLDNDAIAKAGDAVKTMEDKLSSNALISEMRERSADYSDLMHDLNAVIGRVVNGEPESGCSGGCDGCGGSCCH